MRIISGKFKGRKLHGPKNIKIRPTSDRMKEAIFSMIESQKYSNCLNVKIYEYMNVWMKEYVNI